MSTIKAYAIGELRLVVRTDGIYLGHPNDDGLMDSFNTVRVGSSAQTCEQLSVAFAKAAALIRRGNSQEQNG